MHLSDAQQSGRWVVAVAAVIVMVTTGTLYSWAIFTHPLQAAFRWDVTDTTWAYAIANFCVAAVGAILGGFWQDRVGPRRVAMTGVALWGIGNVLAGLGTAMWGCPWLYFSYGIVGGIGAGMAYITPVAMVVKWFPERPGLAGGLVASGFGLGAFVYNQVVPRLADFRTAARHAGDSSAQILSSSDIGAVMHVFVGSGLTYLVVGLAAASLFRNPQVGRSPPAATSGLAPSQILRTRQFYLLWLQLFINVIAGIAIISNAIVILEDLTHLKLSDIAPVFGLISLCNALGRLLWGAVSDRIGCKRTFASMFAVQAVVLFWLSDVHDLHRALAGFALILLCCGGGFGVMPSYSAKCFGTRFMGLNYGLVLSAWGCAGLVGPLLIARLKDLNGSFVGIMPLIGALLAAAVILPLLTSEHGSRAASPPTPMKGKFITIKPINEA